MGRSPNPHTPLPGDQPCRFRLPVAPPPAGEPEMPGHLNDVARDEWARIVPVLISQGLLTIADGPALGLYCSAFARLYTANQELVFSVTSTTAAGNEKTNPAVNVAKEAEASMLRVLIQFGQTPLARSRVSAPVSEDDDGLNAFLARAQSVREFG